MKQSNAGHRIRTPGRTALASLFQGVIAINRALSALGPARCSIGRGGGLLILTVWSGLGLLAHLPVTTRANADAGSRRTPQESQGSRPRRSTDSQDEKPIKLST